MEKVTEYLIFHRWVHSLLSIRYTMYMYAHVPHKTPPGFSSLHASTLNLEPSAYSDSRFNMSNGSLVPRPSRARGEKGAAHKRAWEQC